MRKEEQYLTERVEQCGNITYLNYDAMHPKNSVYDAISKSLSEYDYPVLLTSEKGKIPANRAFALDVSDISIKGKDNVKASIVSVVKAKGDMLGDLKTIYCKTDSDLIKEYYIDTALCYAWDFYSKKHMLVTASKTVVDKIPKVGGYNKLKPSDNEFLDYPVWRLYPRSEGYFLQRQMIDITHCYICPLAYIQEYTSQFTRLSSENLLLINYKKDDENAVIRCTRSKEHIDSLSAYYLDNSFEKIGEVRVCDVVTNKTNKIVAIPAAEIISYKILQRY